MVKTRIITGHRHRGSKRLYGVSAKGLTYLPHAAGHVGAEQSVHTTEPRTLPPLDTCLPHCTQHILHPRGSVGLRTFLRVPAGDTGHLALIIVCRPALWWRKRSVHVLPTILA